MSQTKKSRDSLDEIDDLQSENAQLRAELEEARNENQYLRKQIIFLTTK